jgi:hypothetical protein
MMHPEGSWVPNETGSVAGISLSNMGGTSSHVLCKPAKILEDDMDHGHQTYPSSIFAPLLEHFLHDTEQSLASWDGQHHEPQFPQEHIPLVGADSLLTGRDGLQQFKQTGNVVWWELDHLLEGVNDTP